MKKELSKFEFGDFVYNYYRFMDRFHTEPKTWRELFEFTSFISVDSGIKNIFMNTKGN